MSNSDTAQAIKQRLDKKYRDTIRQLRIKLHNTEMSRDRYKVLYYDQKELSKSMRA